MDHLKFIEDSEDIIEGWGAPYGGPLNGSDLYGERFTKSTDFCLDWFPESRPLLYEHGLEGSTQTAVVGHVKSWEVRDEGLWVRAQLDRSSKYLGAIKQLIDQGALFFSSGAMGHLVRKSIDGTITRWPWVEMSLTPQPVNAFSSLDWATTKSHYKSIGLDLDVEGLKAVMDSADRDALSDSDFAYIDNDGNRKLPLNDAAHVRDALSRFDETTFESDSAKSAAHEKIMAAAKKFGIDTADSSSKSMDPKSFAEGLLPRIAALTENTAKAGQETVETLEESVKSFLEAMKEQERLEAERAAKSMEGSYEDLIEDLSSALNPESPFGAPAYSCIVATFPDSVIVCRYDDEEDGPTYWKVGYTMGDDGDPVLGKAEQVEQTYVPVKSMDDAVPLTLDASMLSRRAAALVQRTEGLHERRVKEGRTLSVANRQRLADAVKTLDEARSTLASLLDESQKMTEDQAKAKALASPDGLRRRLAALELLVDTLPEDQQPA